MYQKLLQQTSQMGQKIPSIPSPGGHNFSERELWTKVLPKDKKLF